MAASDGGVWLRGITVPNPTGGGIGYRMGQASETATTTGGTTVMPSSIDPSAITDNGDSQPYLVVYDGT